MIRLLSTVTLLCAALAAFECDGRAADPPAELAKGVDFPKPVEAPLHEVVDLLSREFGLKIEVDLQAFAAEKRNYPKDDQVSIPRIPSISLETALRYALSPAGAVFEIRGKTVVILPNRKQGKAVDFPPHSRAGSQRHKDLLAKIAKPVDIDKDIEAPLKDVLEFLQDRFDFTIALTSAQKNNIGETRVKIQNAKYTLGEMLKITLKQANSTYIVEPDHLRVVPLQES
jgi:hypothetical protein